MSLRLFQTQMASVCQCGPLYPFQVWNSFLEIGAYCGVVYILWIVSPKFPLPSNTRGSEDFVSPMVLASAVSQQTYGLLNAQFGSSANFDLNYQSTSKMCGSFVNPRFSIILEFVINEWFSSKWRPILFVVWFQVNNTWPAYSSLSCNISLQLGMTFAASAEYSASIVESLHTEVLCLCFQSSPCRGRTFLCDRWKSPLVTVYIRALLGSRIQDARINQNGRIVS